MPLKATRTNKIIPFNITVFPIMLTRQASHILHSPVPTHSCSCAQKCYAASESHLVRYWYDFKFGWEPRGMTVPNLNPFKNIYESFLFLYLDCWFLFVASICYPVSM